MNTSILGFAGSNSTTSINKKLVEYVLSKIESEKVILDLNDFQMPIYSSEREKATGIPQEAKDFFEHIKKSNAIVLSLAEHNGAYSAAFKNIFDWVSRYESDVWQKKPMLLMATSPGGRGGKTVLDIAEAKFNRMTSPVITFSLPSFYDNFDTENLGIKSNELSQELDSKISEFVKAIL